MLLIALIVVLPRRLPRPLAGALRPWRAIARGLHVLHSGHSGDYIAWVTVGAAILLTVFSLSFG